MGHTNYIENLVITDPLLYGVIAYAIVREGNVMITNLVSVPLLWYQNIIDIFKSKVS